MPKTYYDSELTAAEIESVLQAIHGVVSPSNNGKILGIESGRFVAKSASEYSGDVVLEPLNVTANGDYYPRSGTDGFDEVHVSVPSATLTTKSITQNGTYNASFDNADGYSSVVVNVSGGGGGAVVQPLSVTQNGTYNPPSGVDGYAPVMVNVSGGGSSKGFEVYAADGAGGARKEHGFLNNDYFVCFFDDNMSSTYTLNGVSATFSTIATGKQQILATTRNVVNPSVSFSNAALTDEGSLFTAFHHDGGSHISVVGGWAGYPAGGTIYESAAVGTSNSVTLNSAHEILLIFIGASSNTSGITTIDLNGVTYTIENIGYHFGAYGMYTAIEINGNTDTNITVTLPASCWSYVSVIGIDS